MRNTEIHLGGTARSQEDVLSLSNLGLNFAEIPITQPEKFLFQKTNRGAKPGLQEDYNRQEVLLTKGKEELRPLKEVELAMVEILVKLVGSARQLYFQRLKTINRMDLLLE